MAGGRSRGARRSGAARGGWRTTTVRGPSVQPDARGARQQPHHPPEEAQQLDKECSDPAAAVCAPGPLHCVLDLACGKGGDLTNWDKAKVDYCVGVDIAEGSINNGRKKLSFPARLLCTDCYEARLDELFMRMLLLIYVAVSLLYIIRGQLQHVLDKPWQMCLHCFVLEEFLSGRCLMQTSLSKGFENLKVWNLGTVFTGLALVKSMLKRNSLHPDLLVLFEKKKDLLVSGCC